MLVINPDECIDCGVCEPECPAEAIIPDTSDGSERWVAHNQQYSQSWPNISRKKTPPEDADEWLTVKNKFANFFSDKPGK